MALTNSYVQVYGQIPSFLRAIQDAQAPERFTQRYLKDLGFNSANHRALIPLLKALGFLSADGTPTSKYLAFRDRSQSRRVLGEAIRSAYGELFTIKANPTESDRPLIEGKFKSVHNCSDRLAKLMANTFFALLENADVEPAKSPNPPPPKVDEPPRIDKLVSGADSRTVTPPPGLHYNIQIHLPATKDIEVYNAIFKSLREHLLA